MHTKKRDNKTNSNLNNKREEWADIAKGIGIILVRIGHQTIFGIPLVLWIYSFHMPLFFFISGYFYKPKDSFKEEIKHKAYSILIPYFSYECLKWFLGVIKSIINNNINFNLKFFGGIFLSIPDTIFENPIWFFTCLFVANVLFGTLYRIIQRLENNKELYLFISSCIISLITYVLYCIIKVKLPWNLDIALIILPFMSIGYIIHNHKITEKLKDEARKYYYSSIVIFVIASTLTCYINYLFGKNNIDYALRNLNEWFSCISTGIIGCILTYLICLLFKKLRIISFIGQNSGLYYLMLGTVSATISKIITKILGSDINQILLFFVTLVIAIITMIPICLILNKYFSFFIGKWKRKKA